MSSSSSSICSRLHGIFKNSSANKIPLISSLFKDNISPKSTTKTIPKSKTKPKPKSVSEAAKSDLSNGDKQIKTQPKSGSKPVLSNKDKKIKILVKKFKNFCKSSHYRSRSYHFEHIGHRLSAAGKKSEIEEIVEYQKQFSDITQEKFVVRLIFMYGKAGMFDHAQKLFDEMPKLKCERTVLSVNALLAASVCSKKYDKLSGLIIELPKLLKIELDIFSYNIVVNAFIAMGDIKSASLVIEEMEKNGIEPDLITYNTLLEGHYKAKKFKEADQLWTVMELKNVSPTVKTYNAKIRGLISDDRMSQAAD